MPTWEWWGRATLLRDKHTKPMGYQLFHWEMID